MSERPRKFCKRCGEDTPRGKLTEARKRNGYTSGACLSCCKRRNALPENTARRARYRATERGKEAGRRGAAKYDASPRGRAARAEYRRSPAGKAARAAWLAENPVPPEKKAQYQRTYAATTNGRLRRKLAVARRRARRRDAQVELTPTERADYVRFYAEGGSHGLDVDHIVPLVWNGEDAPWNFELLPRSANAKKGDRLLQHDYATMFIRRCYYQQLRLERGEPLLSPLPPPAKRLS